jgi:hypothetical protein
MNGKSGAYVDYPGSIAEFDAPGGELWPDFSDGTIPCFGPSAVKMDLRPAAESRRTSYRANSATLPTRR